MKGDEAREILGLPADSRPSLTQIKAAYKKKVWDSHPDRFPEHARVQAESSFKAMQEAYSYLIAGGGADHFSEGTCVRVVRKGVYGAHKRGTSALIKAPFLLIILGTLSLGGFHAKRAYQRQKEQFPVSNPFLP
ncbi:chaperone DnaJ-domain superfamily protein [Wolffia australiana]